MAEIHSATSKKFMSNMPSLKLWSQWQHNGSWMFKMKPKWTRNQLRNQWMIMDMGWVHNELTGPVQKGVDRSSSDNVDRSLSCNSCDDTFAVVGDCCTWWSFQQCFLGHFTGQGDVCHSMQDSSKCTQWNDGWPTIFLEHQFSQKLVNAFIDPLHHGALRTAAKWWCCCLHSGLTSQTGLVCVQRGDGYDEGIL